MPERPLHSAGAGWPQPPLGFQLCCRSEDTPPLASLPPAPLSLITTCYFLFLLLTQKETKFFLSLRENPCVPSSWWGILAFLARRPTSACE